MRTEKCTKSTECVSWENEKIKTRQITKRNIMDGLRDDIKIKSWMVV